MKAITTKMDEMALTVKKEPEEDVEYFHQANLEMETEINFPIKQEKVFVEDWRHYQEQESGSDLLTLPPLKEEFDTPMMEPPPCKSVNILMTRPQLEVS
uniref:Uncharacterized protein n=1 Tax=Timema genevievae TaxID=629358 RepID=A0A7R9K837_TIMGE|nr:unnamed protein product [Timema genevievae]